MRECTWKPESLTKWMLPRSRFPFFCDELLDILFSDIQSEVGKKCEKQQIVSSLESEQSVNLDDDELQSFLEQQKNCNTQK